MVHGHRMHLHEPATDRFISAPLLAGAPYDVFETQLVLAHVRPGDVVIDLGAHVGYYTLLLARQVGPHGKVFAFEPDPANFELLRRNVEENGYGNVTLVRKAASDRNGTAQLYRSTDNQGDQRLYPSTEARPSVDVETVRLDDFFADSAIRLSLMKMDIQGCEAMALDGMREILARSPEVKLVCEFWPFGLRRSGSSPQRLLQLLAEHGFQLQQISAERQSVGLIEAEELLRRYPETEESFTNLFCARIAVEQPNRVGAPKVSWCLIVKNEEANLADCLAPVRELVEEIIVVDTGSTDCTREIAASLGARVFEFPWVDSFSAARNACLTHATGQWIFWLDADDRIDADNRERLRALLAGLGNENDAWVMKCHCLPGPEGGSGTVVDHVRLFRNVTDLRWDYRVHEQILPAVRRAGHKVRWCDVVIQHVGYQDSALRQRKLQRDWRLLQKEHTERPDDAFILFNLGSISVETGRLNDALGYLQRSLAKSDPRDSIVRKLYALLAQCHRLLGQGELSLCACRKGREFYPDDVELLFQDGLTRRATGDRAGARDCWMQMRQPHRTDHFASIDAALCGYKTLHNLADLELEAGNLAEAESHWRSTLAAQPDFVPARLGLGEVYLRLGRWADLEQTATTLAGVGLATEGELLRVRGYLARGEFSDCYRLLERIIAEAPKSPHVLRVLSHALLQEGKDWPAAERVLRSLIALDPADGEARNNLGVLLRRQGLPADSTMH
jgi:FkbM family methyltransferase